jgi:acetamidase/formamidase
MATPVWRVPCGPTRVEVMQRFASSIRYLSFGEPVGVVHAGEVFEVAATNAFGDPLGSEHAFEAVMRDPSRSERHHSCVGPIEVVDCPSDASLAVRIRRIRPLNALIAKTLAVQGVPSIGVASTADEVRRSLGRCAAVGGNLDIPLLQAGATVYLPVNAPRAQIAIGDVHFRQGAGEIPGMGLESDAIVELEVEFAEKLPFPVVETPERVAIVGWGDDFAAASRCATENAIAYLGRLMEFRGCPPARIYQLLGGCDLIPGNLTGRVATCAIAISRAMFAQARSRVPIVGAPALLRPRGALLPEPCLVEEAVRRFDALPLVHLGNSREIRQLWEHPRLLACRLRDRAYSHEARGYVDALGTAIVRAEINARLSQLLAQSGVATSTVATSGPFVLMTAEDVAERIEVVVKSAWIGDPRHRYPEMADVATRPGRVFEATKHEPYVRFDWRRAPPHDDTLLPDELADYFIDVGRARATALRAFHMLRVHLAAHDLDLPDVCFFMNKAGDVICGELSPDNMSRITYVGPDKQLEARINGRGKAGLAARFRAIADLLAARHSADIPADTGLAPSAQRRHVLMKPSERPA